MATVTLVFALVLMLFEDHLAYGQAMRGGGFGGARSSGGWTSPPASARGQAVPAPQRSLSSQAPAPAPRVGPSFQPNPIPHHQNWVHPAPTIKGPVFSAKPFVSAPPLGTIGTPGLRLHSRPPYLHHRPHFHRHPGVVIFAVPEIAGTTVITQVAPGVVQQERRYGEEPPPEISGRGGPESVAPFDPTPHEVVERMLALAGVKKGDVVYDLGAGDGRILVAAAKKYAVRAVGFETDPGLAKLARENARTAGVEKLVEIREQDFLSADLSRASLVTLYLSYDGNLAVRDQLRSQLRPGARVVSYTFDMGDWPAKIAESYRDKAGNAHSLYLWEITPPALASRAAEPMLQPQPNRAGPLIIDVR
jgi:precorrin-6B methylase 2